MTALIFQRELRHSLGAPWTWALLAILQALVAWQFLAQLDLFQQYLPRIRQLPEPPGAVQFVVLPTLQLSALLMLVLIPLLTMASFSGERRQGTLALYYSAPVPLHALVLGRFFAALCVLGIAWGLQVVMALALAGGTALDMGTLSCAFLALALLMAAAVAVSLWASALSSHPAVAGMLAFGLLLGLWLIDWNSAADGEGVLALISMTARFQRLAGGFVHVFDIAYFTLLITLGLALAIRALRAETRGLRNGGPGLSRLRHAGLSTAILAACVAAAGLATRMEFARDFSAGARHTLAPASMQALAALDAPVTLTAWFPPSHPALPALQTLVARYKRQAPDLTLQVRDPAEAPDVVRAEALEEGTLVITSGSREARTTSLAEDAVTRALIKLSRGDGDWLAFVTGHGERSPERGANFDMEAWAGVLRTRGYKVQELDLDTFGVVPDNTALVVLASPVLDLNEREHAILETWLARGGALLWMTEPDSPQTHATLARSLGVRLPDGLVQSAAGARHGVKDNRLLVLDSAPKVATTGGHPSAKGLRGIVLMPNAAALEWQPHPSWITEPLLATGKDATRTRDSGEILARGPQTIALALHRAGKDAGREQRVILVGDGDFVSNTYLGNGDNQALATQWVDWLTGNDGLLGIETRLAPDVALDFTPWQQAALALGFLGFLPLGLAGVGLWLRLRERHA